MAKLKSKQTEAKQRSLQDVIAKLDESGYVLRDGLFMDPINPDVPEDAVYLLRRLDSSAAQEAFKSLSSAVMQADVISALAELLVDGIVSAVDCSNAPDQFTVSVATVTHADGLDRVAAVYGVMDDLGFRCSNAELREDGAIEWHLFEKIG